MKAMTSDPSMVHPDAWEGCCCSPLLVPNSGEGEVLRDILLAGRLADRAGIGRGCIPRCWALMQKDEEGKRSFPSLDLDLSGSDLAAR